MQIFFFFGKEIKKWELEDISSERKMTFINVYVQIGFLEKYIGIYALIFIEAWNWMEF